MNYSKLLAILSATSLFAFADQTPTSPYLQTPALQHPNLNPPNRSPNPPQNQEQRPRITEAKQPAVNSKNTYRNTKQQYNLIPAGTYTATEAQTAMVNVQTEAYMKEHPDADRTTVSQDFSDKMETSGETLNQFMGVQLDPLATYTIEHPTADSTTITTTIKEPTPILGTKFIVPEGSSLSVYKDANADVISFSNAQGPALKISTPAVPPGEIAQKVVTVYQTTTLSDGTLILPGTYDHDHPSIDETLPPIIYDTP
ncbi:MAG: hypothetical protein K2Y01_02910 [Rhabdochlamydiaceae bacterium]|nr:hypothetical protein [Rhabdochlamydiaceae bacterium]